MLLGRNVLGRSRRFHFGVSLLAASWLAACGRVGIELIPADGLGGGHDGSGRADASTPGGDDAGALDASACPTACENTHGTASCESGSCLLGCELGYADCDSDPGNGCEVRTAGELMSCGGCGVSCENAHGASVCSSGLCAPSCDPGFGDCDADAANGCEADLASAQNCGTCGASCQNPNGSAACVAGSCVPTCNMGFADCDGFPENGCETNINSDPRHCGSCPNACGTNGQICVNGGCEASQCAPGLGECDGDLTQTCETDIEGSIDDCGFCGNRCNLQNASPRCSGGSCSVSSCSSGFGDCDNNPANGCEVTLATSSAHCGACGAPCQNANGTTNCVASRCVPSCSTGFGDCDSSRTNGCETALSSVSNCGMCGRTCPANGGTAVCNAGVCETLCNLSGTYALHMTVQGSWPSTSIIASGSGTFEFWMKLRATQSGNSLNASLTECGRFIPRFDARSVNETFSFHYPNSLFDGNFLPSSATTVTLGSSSPGASFTLPATAVQMGVDMALAPFSRNPVTGAWPSQASQIPAANRIDMDGDGRPGVTAEYEDNADHPRTDNNLFAPRSDNPYVASRVSFSLSGSMSSCSGGGGSASFRFIDTRIYACSLESGECSASQASFLDENCLDYALGSASYTLLKVADNATCAQIRSAL
jgi:hypothetical protein